LLGILVSGVGFLIALGINHWSEQQKEKETYRSMLLAIRSEATANKEILANSYGEYFPQGLVIKEFSYSTVTQMFASPLFMKYAKPGEIETLNSYVRDLTLANGYRRVCETLTLFRPPGYKAWLENVKNEWGKRLPDVSADIDKVIDIKGES
jgi:hypothetical protein